MSSKSTLLIGTLILFLASVILFGISIYIFPSKLALGGAFALLGTALIAAANFFSGVESISNIINTLLSPQRKLNFFNINKYKQLLRHQNLFFDVRGLRTQGRFPLDLELIFVELRLSPNVPNKLSNRIAGDSQIVSSEVSTIWDFLRENKTGHYVLVGLPGSGKTTLLRNMVSVLIADSKTQKKYHAPHKKLPILLNLRECAADIDGDNSFSLRDAIQNQVAKWSGQAVLITANLIKQLNKGHCVIMLDGLDEVANSNLRLKVARWIEKQIANYPKNSFIVTSRPFGYKDNPLQGLTILEVKPFSIEQIGKFIENWYAANLFAEHKNKSKHHATEMKSKSADLFKRITTNQSLADLAVNPLLITMMAIVHDNRGLLPTRRVELYDEIFEVLLERHQRSKEIPSILSTQEQQKTLQPLAYYMMVNELEEIPINQARKIISEELSRLHVSVSSDQLLKQIENNGILYDASIDRYGFAHRTFQEYLSAIHIKENRLENTIPQKMENNWWKETILLYAAKYNPSKFVDACLRKGTNSPNLLALAAECVDEAIVDLEPAVQKLFEDVFTKGAVHPDKNIRRVIANANLTRRLRNLLRISDDKSIDLSFVTHSEYQLFLDETFKDGNFYQPDHWQSFDFSTSIGTKPITGIRSSDAKAFCIWLTKERGGLWHYRLPRYEEIEGITLNQGKSVESFNCWLENGTIENSHNVSNLPPLKIPESRLQHLIFREVLLALYYCLTFISVEATDEIILHLNLVTSDINNVLSTKQDDQSITTDLSALDKFANALNEHKTTTQYNLNVAPENLISLKSCTNEFVSLCQDIHVNFLKVANAGQLARIHTSSKNIEQEIEVLNEILNTRQIIKNMVGPYPPNEEKQGFIDLLVPLKNLDSQLADTLLIIDKKMLFKNSKALQLLKVTNTFINDLGSRPELSDFTNLPIDHKTICSTLPERFEPLGELKAILQEARQHNASGALIGVADLLSNILLSEKPDLAGISRTRTWLNHYKEYCLIRCIYGMKIIDLLHSKAALEKRSIIKFSINKPLRTLNLSHYLSLFYALYQVEARSNNEALAFESIRIVSERNY